MPKRPTRRPLRQLPLLRSLLPLLLGLATGYQAGQHLAPSPLTLPEGSVAVRFSPKGGCLNMALDTINHTEKTLYVAAYSLTSQPIADALIAAHRRGVQVWILADKLQSRGKGSQLPKLHKAGIPIRLDRAKIGHNKVMIADGKHLLTGSYNWTKSAEYYNAENLLSLHMTELCTLYHADLQARYNRGKPYVPA